MDYLHVRYHFKVLRFWLSFAFVCCSDLVMFPEKKRLLYDQYLRQVLDRCFMLMVIPSWEGIFNMTVTIWNSVTTPLYNNSCSLKKDRLLSEGIGIYTRSLLSFFSQVFITTMFSFTLLIKKNICKGVSCQSFLTFFVFCYWKILP